MGEAVPRCGAQLRRCGRPTADLLRLFEANAEDAPNDKLDRKPQPRVPTADQDAGLVLNRGSSTDSALRPDAFGQIRMRRIHGYQRLSKFIATDELKLAS